MIKKKVILFFLVAIILFGFASSVFALNWPDSPATKSKLIPTCPPPEKAPGCIPTDLTSAIKYFYEWAIVLGGLAAFIMLLAAGFQYLTSTGDPTKTKDARDRIGSAIGGLVLLLASFLILNIINPELTGLSALSRDKVKGLFDFTLGKSWSKVGIPDCKEVIVYKKADFLANSKIDTLIPGAPLKSFPFSERLGNLSETGGEGSFEVNGNCTAALYPDREGKGDPTPLSLSTRNLSIIRPEGFGSLRIISNTTPVPAGASTLTFNAEATADGTKIRGTAITIRPGTPVTLSWGISGLGFNSCQAQSDPPALSDPANPSTNQWGDNPQTKEREDLIEPTAPGSKIISGLAKTTTFTFFLACSGSKAGAVGPPEQPKSVSVSVTEQPVAKEDFPTVVLTLKKESLQKGKDNLIVTGVQVEKDEDKQIADEKAPVVDFPSGFNPNSDIARFTWKPTNTKRCLGQGQLAGSNSKDDGTGSANPSIAPLQSIPGTYVFAILCEGKKGGAVYAPIKINVAP